MTSIAPDSSNGWSTPAGGWPTWAWTVPYLGEQQPKASRLEPIESGANCQRYAYAVLGLFGISVPPHRSSELWEDPSFLHPGRGAARPLDLVLFNQERGAWGAHVALYMADNQLLHLCAEIGRPVVWGWEDFATRARYASVVGLVRPAR